MQENSEIRLEKRVEEYLQLKNYPISKKESLMKEFGNRNELPELVIPIGGIGTGTISMTGWGSFRDFEIMNKPAKGFTPERTFFSVCAKPEGGKPVAKVLQGPAVGSLNYPHGYPSSGGAGLPHFDYNFVVDDYPVINYIFPDYDASYVVNYGVLNPFIPLNEDDSSIPCSIFSFSITNLSKKETDFSLAFNIENFASHPEKGRGVNIYKETENLKGIFLCSEENNPEKPSLAITTNHKNTTAQTAWQRGKWFDGIQRFWNKFSKEGKLEENYEKAQAEEGANDIASICLHQKLNPQEDWACQIFLTWHFPVFKKYFYENSEDAEAGETAKKCCGKDNQPSWKNWYAVKFKDAWDTAEYIAQKEEYLIDTTLKFLQTFEYCSIPGEVIKSMRENLSILKSTSVIRLEDGSLYGFEGCSENAGCCHGTCSHVWNYAQAHAYLFPRIAQKMRENDYDYNMDDEGHVNFRSWLPLKKDVKHNFHAAADGQLGGIIQIYREWLLSGDDEWLRKIWVNKAEKALKYVWKYWDKNMDGVIEGIQHNTYDVEFHGPNTMIGSLYLTALKCASLIENRLGNSENSRKYEAILEKGKRWIDNNLFNTDYYFQEVNPDAWKLKPQNLDEKYDALFTKTLDPKLGIPKYQYATGCLSDQLIGEWYAAMLNLPPILKSKNVKTALKNIFRKNFKKELKRHCNTQRIYALDDEGGLLLCTWDNDYERPVHPFPYSDEVWTGIEFQVASHLVYEGYLDESMKIIDAVRKRYDGTRRNPYNPIECGNHYVRALSSYALLLAWSGFQYNASEEILCFAPKMDLTDFSFFFTTGKCWGDFRVNTHEDKTCIKIILHHGDLKIKKLVLTTPPSLRVLLRNNGGKEIADLFKNQGRENDLTYELGDDCFLSYENKQYHDSLEIELYYD